MVTVVAKEDHSPRRAGFCCRWRRFRELGPSYQRDKWSKIAATLGWKARLQRRQRFDVCISRFRALLYNSTLTDNLAALSPTNLACLKWPSVSIPRTRSALHAPVVAKHNVSSVHESTSIACASARADSQKGKHRFLIERELSGVRSCLAG